MVFEAFIIIIKQALILLIVLKVLLSYFVDPYHPIRQVVDRIVEPMLRPIRQIVPHVGRFDFSPIMLLILIQVIATIIRYLI